MLCRICKRIRGICLVGAAVGAIGSPALGEFNPSDTARLCAQDLSSEQLSLDASGSWQIVKQRSGGYVLCLTGSLSELNLAEFARSIAERPPEIMVVRSAGGPSEVWLEIALLVEDARPILVVDNACFSACANYMPVVAARTITVPGSLLVWHGGATDQAVSDYGQELTVQDMLELITLSERTQRLYARQGVSLDILKDSQRPTDAAIMRRTLEQAGADSSGRVIAGYAYSPATLEKCFGFNGMSEMWHPGTDADVVTAIAARTSRLAAFESPKDASGIRTCVNNDAKQ